MNNSPRSVGSDPSWYLVGEVQALYRYPVKSMGGEILDHAHIGWHGVAGDRRYAFLRADSRSGLPWLSAREFPPILRYHSYYPDDDAVRKGQPMVIVPGGEVVPVASRILLDKLSDDAHHALHPIQLWRGTYDAMDVSLITTGSLNSISQAVGRDLEPQRFRPNIIIDAIAERRYPEDKWVSHTICFGAHRDGARVRIARKDERCAIVNFDPATAVSDPQVLREIIRLRRNLLGVYAQVERPGQVCKGDPVWIR